VPFLIVLIVYKKFFRNGTISIDAFKFHFLSLPWYWFIVLPVFAILNWSLEMKKWQYLVLKLEKHSFKEAAKGVMSGVAVSQLLPYRTGEYLGRLAFVKDENKIEAGILSVAGSFSQLLITLLFGIAAFVYLEPIPYPISFLVSFLALLLLLVFGYMYLPQFKALNQFVFFQKLKHALQLLNTKDLIYLLLMSFLRYISFVLPFSLLVLYFDLGIDSSVFYAMTAVACIYFLQTVSPNFILTDIAIRIGVSTLVFSGSMFEINTLDYVPGLVIYVFNVLIPMFIGAFVLILLKLKR
jgi:hypothetical protein